MRALAAAGFLLLLLGQGPAPIRAGSAAPPEMPAPTVSVSFSRGAIRENDVVRAVIWVANTADLPVTAELHLSSPGFLKWQLPNGGGKPVASPWTLGRIEPRSYRNWQLDLHSGAEIQPGEFNLLFTLVYSWSAAGKSHQAFVTTEKALKVSLFGSDNIAGIPINLAGFIVPGLAFWLVLGVFRVHWLVNIALAEKTLYSVLVSLAILFLGDRMQWLEADAAIGVSHLAALAAVGGVVGLVVSGLHHAVRWTIENRREADRRAATVEESSDPLEVQLEKLLRIHGPAPQPLIWELTVGEERYFGSLVVTAEKQTWLIGWFRVGTAAADAQTRGRLLELKQAGKLAEVVQLARARGLPIVLRTGIREGEWDEAHATDDDFRSFQSSAVTGRQSAPASEEWEVLEIE